MGMPYLATVILPHPIGGIDLEEVERKVDLALEDMMEVLTMPREKLPERGQKRS